MNKRNNQTNAPSSKLTKLIKSDRSITVWITIAFFVIAWWLLPVRNGVILRWMEEYSLFDPTEYAREELMLYPGGLLQYAGSYLMQFMHYPALGSVILFILWSILAFITAKCFQLSKFTSPIALLLPAFLLESVLVIDQEWLTILYRGYMFAPTLGFISTVILIWCFRLIKSQWLSCLFSVATVCMYPLLGFYALLASLTDIIIVITRFRRDSISLPIIHIIINSVLIFFIPLIYYRFFTGTWVESHNLWLKGLPDLIVGDNDTYLFMPFILCSLTIIVMAAIRHIESLANRVIFAASVASVIAANVWCIVKADKPEESRAMALMQIYMDQMRWERVARVASNMHGPLTSELAYLATMAREICNMPPVEFEIKDWEDSQNQRKRPDFMRTAYIFVPANYFMGRSNLSYRWAMEHSVMYGKRVFLLKYMVRDCLLNGDYELARHYNDILGRTLFHKKWSEHYGKFIDNPELIADDPELGKIPHMKTENVFF